MRLLFGFRMVDMMVVKPMMKGHQRKPCVSRTLREDGRGHLLLYQFLHQVRQNLFLLLPDHYPPSLGDLGYPSRVAVLDLCLVTLVGIILPSTGKALSILLMMCSYQGEEAITKGCKDPYKRFQNEVRGLKWLALWPGLGVTLDSAPLITKSA